MCWRPDAPANNNQLRSRRRSTRWTSAAALPALPRHSAPQRLAPTLRWSERAEPARPTEAQDGGASNGGVSETASRPRETSSSQCSYAGPSVAAPPRTSLATLHRVLSGSCLACLHDVWEIARCPGGARHIAAHADSRSDAEHAVDHPGGAAGGAVMRRIHPLRG